MSGTRQLSGNVAVPLGETPSAAAFSQETCRKKEADALARYEAATAPRQVEERREEGGGRGEEREKQADERRRQAAGRIC